MSDKGTELYEVLTHYGASGVPDSGGWRSVCCPFHSDSRASARVSISDGAFFCHGCGIGGDSISLVMKAENCDFPSAISKLEKITGRANPGLSEPTRRESGRYLVSGEPARFEQGSGFSTKDWLRRDPS